MSTTITIVVDAGTGTGTDQSTGTQITMGEAGPPPADELAGTSGHAAGDTPESEGMPEGPPPTDVDADVDADGGADAGQGGSAPEPMALEDLD